MKNMTFKVIDRLFLVVHATADPTDEEWIAYLQEIELQGIERTVQLILTEGGSPTATQRRFLSELLAGRFVPVAVMSSSAATRGIVTALSWFNCKIRAFSATDLRAAISAPTSSSARWPSYVSR